jgi:DNA-binding MarR family transcriptional regulator
VREDHDLVDAFLTASRVLVAVAARSLAAAEADVTLPQYRVLVVLASRGRQRIVDLAEQLAVNSSSATRICDRLEGHGLVRREPSPEDRRVVWVSITADGERLVRQVSNARRDHIANILAAMPAQYPGRLLAALRAFSDAAHELPEQEWSSGWDMG